jgi:TRAP-type C4-dicarboxylate transport system permease small subunit
VKDGKEGEVEMKGFIAAVYRLDVFFQAISGGVLGFMVLLTLTDVVLRNLGRPFVGAYEIVSFCGSVVVGFAMPYTSWKRGHIFVDFVIEKLGPKGKECFRVGTRCLGIVLFIFVGVNFIRYGFSLLASGEVSPGFKLPYYPIPFGLSLSCFLLSLTLVGDLMRGAKEEKK